MAAVGNPNGDGKRIKSEDGVSVGSDKH